MNQHQTLPSSFVSARSKRRRLFCQLITSQLVFWSRVLFIVLIGSSVMIPRAKAVQTLEITAPQIRVYSKPDLLSPLITVLKKGSTVLAADNPMGQFKKVLVKNSKGQKTVGFVSLAELKGTKVPTQSSRVRHAYATSKNLHNKWSAGLILGLNYQTEGAKTYTDGQGGSANVGSLSGSAFMFGALVNIPYSQTFTIEGFLLYKPTSGTAVASPNSAVVGTATQTIILAENFLAVGATAKWYNAPTGSWWYGGGLEFDLGSSGTLQYGSQSPITLATSNLPNLILAYASTGYDLGLGGNYFLVPRINAGAIFNTSPPIIEVDALINLLYSF